MLIKFCDKIKCPTTAEVDVDDYSSLPYDPNLVCYNVIIIIYNGIKEQI